MSQLARLSEDVLRIMVAAIANPLEPHPVVAFAATCNFIHTALATPPRPDELSELGKLHESYLATCTLCRKAGTRCAAVCCAERLSWHVVGITARDAAGLTVLLQFSPVLKELYLFTNRIGDAGAAAIAEGLSVNRALNTLWLSGNQISDNGKQALRAVVQGRVGFDLKL